MKFFHSLFIIALGFTALLPVSAADAPNPPASPRAAAQAPRWVLPAIRAPRLQHGTFHSKAAKARVSFQIYTPEVYDTETEGRFPVLYWLHGTGGGLGGIAPVTAFFDRAIRDGKIAPMLIVFANGLATSMWCDSKDGSVPMETVVVKELVPHIDATFRTLATREDRLIEGFSMGGYGAARLGFKYLETFGAVSVLAGGPLDLELKGPRAAGNPEERERLLQGTFGGDLDYFKAQSPLTIVQQQADAVRDNVRVRIAVGARDNTGPLNRAYSDLLKKINIAHAFTIVPGVGHDTLALFNGLGESNWEFYRAVFATRAVSPSVTSTAGANPSPPASVGQRFIPADVDWQHPVYANSFDSAETLKDWKLEGGRRMGIEGGRLLLESDSSDAQNHLVCWLAKEMPADFLLEFKVRPQNRKDGLNILFFNTRGLRGESVFDPALAPRDGLFKQYHSGDLNGYHISYWAGERGTAHVRKNKGFALVATGSDLVVSAPADALQTIRLYKRGGTIRLMVDDVVSVAWDDDGKSHGPVWTHPGWIGLRQMGHTVRCEYDDLRVLPLKP